MYHKRSRLRLTQKPDHARLLTRNLVTSLLLYEAIRTTRKRARVIQPLVDRLITTAKKKEPSIAIRQINAFVTDKNASRKLIQVLAKRYAARPSGFTKSAPAGARKGDGAELVDLTLVDAQIGASALPAAKKKEEKASAKTSTKKKATPSKES